MKHIASRMRDLITSNVDALVKKATNPDKVLRLLRTQVEEALVSMYGDLSKAQRELSHTQEQARKLAQTAEEWTSKAKIAVDHGREDLARSALLARESGHRDAAAVTLEAEKVSGLEKAIDELETKREDIIAKSASHSTKAKHPTQNTNSDAKISNQIDRIDAMERRSAMQSAGETGDVEAEIAQLAQSAKIEAELEAMKAPVQKAKKRKSHAKK